MDTTVEKTLMAATTTVTPTTTITGMGPTIAVHLRQAFDFNCYCQHCPSDLCK